MSERAFMAVVAVAFMVLVASWLRITDVNPTRIDPAFACSPGDTYTVKECP